MHQQKPGTGHSTSTVPPLSHCQRHHSYVCYCSLSWCIHVCCRRVSQYVHICCCCLPWHLHILHHHLCLCPPPPAACPCLPSLPPVPVPISPYDFLESPHFLHHLSLTYVDDDTSPHHTVTHVASVEMEHRHGLRNLTPMDQPDITISDADSCSAA
jgi:hypothetical protein